MDINDLELTVRSDNGLRSVGVTTVEQLLNLSWEQLNAIPNIGHKSISMIAWSCIELLSGRLMERKIEWENKWYPQRDNWEEVTKKAETLDSIHTLLKSTIELIELHTKNAGEVKT